LPWRDRLRDTYLAGHPRFQTRPTLGFGLLVKRRGPEAVRDHPSVAVFESKMRGADGGEM
jgi:hypothetical protein